MLLEAPSLLALEITSLGLEAIVLERITIVLVSSSLFNRSPAVCYRWSRLVKPALQRLLRKILADELARRRTVLGS